MKKALFFLLFSLIINAQNYPVQFTKMDSLQFENTIQQFVKDIDRGFVFDKHEIGIDKNHTYRFTNKETNDDLLIGFYTFNDGENKDLEIKGVKKWTINRIGGKFLSIYPIWKKYIEVNATPEETAKRGTKTFYIGDNWVQIVKGDDSHPWKIRF